MTADNDSGADQSALKSRHIAAATIGNALEFYDFLTYAYFSIQIGRALFPAQSAYKFFDELFQNVVYCLVRPNFGEMPL